MVETLEELENFETLLIGNLRDHEVFANIESMDKHEFVKMLLQRRFFSLEFMKFFDIGVDGFTLYSQKHKQDAVKVFHWLLIEEYPQNQPSHREELIYDLTRIGAKPYEIMSSVPSSETQQALNKIHSLLRPKKNDSNEFYEIRILTTLRLWSEVLVAEEFEKLLPKIESMGLPRKESRYYYPHFEHDKKKTPIHAKHKEASHSDALTSVLQKMLDSSKKISYCAQVEKEVVETKISFYDQFIMNIAK